MRLMQQIVRFDPTEGIIMEDDNGIASIRHSDELAVIESFSDAESSMMSFCDIDGACEVCY